MTDRRPEGDRRSERSPEEARARWMRVQALFHETIGRDPDEREAFVRTACGDDEALASEVLDLIEEDERGHALLDASVGTVARELLDVAAPAGGSIGPYRIERVLGRGGMGVVYLAERADLGLKVAIKVLPDAWLSAERRERFVAEQKTLAALSHPRVARLYDAGLLPDDTPYFVMEYVEGEHLDRYCARAAPGVRARLVLFRAMCDAVSFAHGRAVIHRDLKPSNVMVTEAGEPKLLDFGVAKHLDDVGRDPSDRRTAAPILTPAYAAPEQLQGEPIGVYTDVYALGVILYELLTGHLPHDLASLTPAQAERQVAGTDPPPPSSVVSRAGIVASRAGIVASRAGVAKQGPVPSSEESEPDRSPAGAGAPDDAGKLSRLEWAELDVLCGTAMHRDIDRRYPSVEALARDVDHLLAGTPLEARPDSTTYRVSKFVRRKARTLLVAAGIAGAFLATGAYYAFRLADARDRAVAEADRTRRIQAFTENLFRGGDDIVGPADTLRVLTLLERGVLDARSSSLDPGARSDLYLTLGSIYGELGRFERADSLLGAALEIREGMRPVEPVRRAEVLVARGELRIQEGEYAASEVLLDEALDVMNRSRPRDELAIAGAMTSLGVALEGQGEFDRATSVLEAAVGAFQRHRRGSAEHAEAIAALATTHFYAGNLDVADSLNHRALELDRAIHGNVHPTVADGLINLAASEGQRGRYPEAEPFLREAVAILESYHGPDHPETASALRMLGSNLIYQGRLEEAEPLVGRAFAIQDALLGPLHPRLANTMGDLAYLRLQDGRFDDAVSLYERVVDIYRAANGERHYFVAIGLSNLANALMTGGRLVEAEAIFVECVERFTESRGADHLDTGIARIKLGRVLLRRDRPRDAEVELLAGYEIVAAVAAPTVSWLRAARTDLVTTYEELGLPERAEHFRREQAELDGKAASG